MGRYINVEYFFYQIYRFFSWIGDLIFGKSTGGSITERLFGYQSFFKVVLGFLTLFFMVVVIYCLIRIYEIRRDDKAKLAKAHIAIDEAPFRNTQWDVVLSHLNSDSPSDWRLAIIEADNMLDAMVKKMGYEGEDLGERLKAVEPSDFNSLQSAWEAHKVRNQIVHEGVGFQITKRDADHVIKLYEAVFREFKYI